MSKMNGKGGTAPPRKDFAAPETKANRPAAERPNAPAGREIERRLASKDKPRFGMAEIGRKTK